MRRRIGTNSAIAPSAFGGGGGKSGHSRASLTFRHGRKTENGKWIIMRFAHSGYPLSVIRIVTSDSEARKRAAGNARTP